MSQVSASASDGLKKPMEDCSSLWLWVGAENWYWGTVRATASQWHELGHVECAGIQRSELLTRLAEQTLRLPPRMERRAAKMSLQVVLADAWVSQAVLPWSSAMHDSVTAMAYARAQLNEAGFDVGLNDVIRLDDARHGRPRLALAYPADLVQALARCAQSNLLSLRGVWSASAATWCAVQTRMGTAPSAWLVACEDGVTLMQADKELCWTGFPSGQRRIVDMAQDVSTPDLAIDQMLSRTWARWVLRKPRWAKSDGVGVVVIGLHHDPAIETLAEPLRWVPWSAPETTGGANHVAPPLAGLFVKLQQLGQPVSLKSLSAVANPTRSLGIQIVVLLAAFAALVTAASLASSAARNVSALNDELARTERTATPQPPQITKDQLARVRSVNTAVREINMPLQALLGALAPPPDIRVAIVAVESSGNRTMDEGRSSLKITAQAPSSADMARYVAFVADRKPFTGAFLSKHQWVNQGDDAQVDATTRKSTDGEALLRFVVEAQWAD